MTISKYEKFVAVREFAKHVMEQAGKGQTIAALVEDFNTTAEVMGFGHLWMAKPGRVAKLIEAMEHVLKRLDAMPEYAERVPDVTPEKRAEHMVSAVQLRGILTGHGIDPQDFGACLDYLLNGAHLRYWVKIYVDYVYQVTPFDPAQPGTERTVIAVSTPLVQGTQIHQQIERLIVTGQQAALLRADGYTGELEIVDIMPGFAPSRGVPPVDFYQCLGRGIRITEQNARAIHSRANINTGKANRFPRGKCAARMVELGWEFNEG